MLLCDKKQAKRLRDLIWASVFIAAASTLFLCAGWASDFSTDLPLPWRAAVVLPPVGLAFNDPIDFVKVSTCIQ